MHGTFSWDIIQRIWITESSFDWKVSKIQGIGLVNQPLKFQVYIFPMKLVVFFWWMLVDGLFLNVSNEGGISSYGLGMWWPYSTKAGFGSSTIMGGRICNSSLSTGPAIPNDRSFDGFCTSSNSNNVKERSISWRNSNSFLAVFQPSARNSIPRGFQLSKYLIHLIWPWFGNVYVNEIETDLQYASHIHLVSHTETCIDKRIISKHAHTHRDFCEGRNMLENQPCHFNDIDKLCDKEKWTHINKHIYSTSHIEA